MRQFYLSRQGKSYGPYPEATLRQMATAGQFVPHDMLALVGASTWQKAADVPGLFAARSVPPIPTRPAPAPAAPVRPSSHRIACFGCFDEVVITVAAGAHDAPCPKCGATLQVAEAPRQHDGRPAQAAAFKGIGDDDLMERVNGTVAESEGQFSANTNAALLGLRIVGTILGG